MNQWLYPRMFGKWETSLELLKSSWLQGQETEMLVGEVFNPKQKWGEGLCPVCGESVHTARHVEQIKQVAQEIKENEYK